MAAHLNQQCNNFKDFGVQHYGGKLFSELRDQLDELFLKLPPPVPSASTSSSHSSSSYSSSAAASSPVSMSSYYNSSNPCFAGNCLALMADGTHKSLSTIQKGDLVMTPSGIATRVLCIVETICVGGKTSLVEFVGGLLVTPWHPIQVHGTWEFPANVGVSKERACVAVYSFLLESEHVMTINGIHCVSLAHGMSGKVVAHPYFGTSSVVDDLKQMNGWKDGHVQLISGCLNHDTKSGLVSGMKQFQLLM